jgi:CheY-like chemotaxis protein
VLTQAGHRVTLAANGQQAVELAVAHFANDSNAAEPFDVILMDLLMPVMDGLDATRLIRNAGVTTPIIALTAHVSEDLQAQCLAAGVNGYLSKPIQGRVLLAHLAELRLQPLDPGVTAVKAALPTSAVLDLAAALGQTDGNFDTLKAGAAMVLAQIEQDLPDLRRLCAEDNSDGLMRGAHRLQGSLACMGAQAAVQACLALETLASEGRSDGFAQVLAQLEFELDRVVPELRRLTQPTVKQKDPKNGN